MRAAPPTPGATTPRPASPGEVPTEAGESGISVCVVCRNEADRLGACLDSVSWADERIVMDLSSTDGSATLAREHGARVLTRAPVPYVELVREELGAEARGEWILVLDPDERVSPGLAEELRRLSRRRDIDAVVIPRMNFDLGYPPSHPLHRYEPQLRMYRRSTVHWPRAIHARPQVPEDRVHHLPPRDDLVIVHDRSRNLPEILDHVGRYAPAQAQTMLDRGVEFTARAMLSALSREAYQQLVRGRALADGVPGVLRALTLIAMQVYVWMALWQLSGSRRTPADDRFLRRIGGVLEALRRVGRMGTAPRRLLRRLRGGGSGRVPPRR